MSVEQSFTEARKAHFERAKQIKVNAIVELAETMTFGELFELSETLYKLARKRLNENIRDTTGTGNE